jgi:F0F1-type ATP synthase membrane subunit c/vacuolar-type H+-ATPase subunit K
VAEWQRGGERERALPELSASEAMALHEIAAGIGFGVICLGSCAGVSCATLASPGAALRQPRQSVAMLCVAMCLLARRAPSGVAATFVRFRSLPFVWRAALHLTASLCTRSATT